MRIEAACGRLFHGRFIVAFRNRLPKYLLKCPPNGANERPSRTREKAARRRLSISGKRVPSGARLRRIYLLAAEAAVTAAVAALIAADEAASLADEAAAAAAEADVSAAEAATIDDEAADEAASAAGAVVSAGLLQAARAATATRVANRSDLFMNFLEE